MIPTDEASRWEWIEAYLTGKLDKIQQIETELEMTSNAGFRLEVEEVRKAHKLLQDAHTEQKVREVLRKLQEEPTAVTPVVRATSYWRNLSWMALGAVAACIAFFVYLAASPNQIPPVDDEVGTYRDSDPLAMSSAQREQYEQFYKGQMLMRTGDFDTAIPLFEQVLKEPKLRPYFRQETEWHLCIALVKTDRISEAREYLDRMDEPTDYPIPRMERWKMWVQTHMLSL